MKKIISLFTLVSCYDLTIPKVPTQFEHQPISIESTLQVKKAATVWEDGQFIIYYNSGWMSRITPDAQNFVIQHELSHIYLHHLGEEVYLTKQERINAEKQADCNAIKILQNQFYYNNEQIENVKYFMKHEIRNMSRLQNLEQCLEE
jgi:Zn-dependent peptidase ImmA (M78 family)